MRSVCGRFQMCFSEFFRFGGHFYGTETEGRGGMGGFLKCLKTLVKVASKNWCLE